MEKLYNESYLGQFPEQVYETILQDGQISRNIFEGNQVKQVIYKIDINSLDSKSKCLYNSFQHYIIKCISEGRNVDKCYNYLKQYYNDFVLKPYEFANSPLLSDSFINSLGGDASKIIQFRNDYYSKTGLMELYLKKQENKLTVEEEKRYYSILLHALSSKDSKILRIIEQEIDEIIKENKKVSDIDSTRLQFYAQYVSNFAKEGKDFNTLVLIGDDIPNRGGFENSYTIAMNRNSSFANDLSIFTQCICHETRHAIQEYEAKENISEAAYTMLQNKLFMKYLSTNTCNIYSNGRNYQFNAAELDAEVNGFSNSSIFFGMHGAPELAEQVRNRRIDKYDTRNNYNYYTDVDGKMYPYDIYVVNKLDEIIRNHPEEIRNYPTLQLIYNLDGTRKDFSELLNYNEFGTREIVKSFLNYSISNGELDSIDMSGMDVEKQHRFSQFLAGKNMDYCYSLKEYMNGIKKSPFLHPMKIRTTMYLINNINNVYEYSINNLDNIMNSCDEPISSQNHPFADLIFRLRDVDFDTFSSEIERKVNNGLNTNYYEDSTIVNDLNELKGSIERLKNNYNETLYQYNKIRLVDKLKKMNNSQLAQTVNINGKSYTVLDYYINEVLPKMNGHQEVEFDGKKMHISDYIRQFDNIHFGSDGIGSIEQQIR